MKKLAKLALLMLLGLSAAGCASLPEVTQPIDYTPIVKTVTVTEKEKEQLIRTEEKKSRAIKYKITDYHQDTLSLDVHVKKSEKEILTKKNIFYTPAFLRSYKLTCPASQPYSCEKKLLDEKEVQGTTREAEEIPKEENTIFENEAAADVKVEAFFWQPLGPILLDAKTDSNGEALLDVSALCIALSEKQNKDIFYSRTNIYQYLSMKFNKQLTSEGRDSIKFNRILDKIQLKDHLAHVTLSTNVRGLEGVVENDNLPVDLNMKKFDINDFYRLVKAQLKGEINEWLSLVEVWWEIIDADTLKPVDNINVRFTPIRTKTPDDLRRQQYMLRKRYFFETSELFKRTEINLSDFQLLYDQALPVQDGILNLIAPTPSIYKAEFTDAKENARYYGFTKEVRFPEDKKRTVKLEKIATKVRIDFKGSRGAME